MSLYLLSILKFPKTSLFHVNVLTFHSVSAKKAKLEYFIFLHLQFAEFYYVEDFKKIQLF